MSKKIIDQDPIQEGVAPVATPKPVKYIGPPYHKGIVIAGKQYDLKKYDRSQAEALIAVQPKAAKYFKF